MTAAAALRWITRRHIQSDSSIHDLQPTLPSRRLAEILGHVED